MAGSFVESTPSCPAGSAPATGQVLGTPTAFIDGILHRGGCDPPALLTALAP